MSDPQPGCAGWVADSLRRVPPAAATDQLRLNPPGGPGPPARRGRSAEPVRGGRDRAGRGAARGGRPRRGRPHGRRGAPRDTDVVVWDGASLAGPRDVLDGAWLALRRSPALDRRRVPGGKLLLIAPPPYDAGAEAARPGSRTSRARCRSSGRATASAPPRCCPAKATDPAEVAELAAFLASRAGRLLLRLPLPDGRRVASAGGSPRSTPSSRCPAPARCAGCRSGTSSGSARSAPTPTWPRTPATTSSSRTPRRAPATRSCTSSPAAPRRSRSTARPSTPGGDLRLPARPAGPPPRRRRRAGHDRPLVRRLARPRVRGLGLGGALPRHRDPRAGPAGGARLYEEGLASDQDGQWAHYDLACWHALYGDPARRGGCSTARSSSAATRSARRPAKDPDLAGLRS